MTHIVAMGAGRALMSRPDDPLHEYVLGLTGKARPSIGFLPTASGDDAGYIAAFYDAYPSRRCAPSHLRLFSRELETLRPWFEQQDIIHVGGGNTANMLAIWRLHGVDQLLRQAAVDGTVLCGGSAGALCWFEGGVTDSFGTSLLHPLADGLGLLRGSMCPHYDGDPLRAPAYEEFIARGELGDGFAADDDVALHFDDGALVGAVTARPDAGGYRVAREAEGTGVSTTPLPRIDISARD